MNPIFFASPAEWRTWLTEHHEQESEVVVGYYKKGVDKPTLTWQESVDEALCFGWIDGVRKGIDEERYQIRFTPRKKTSIWSAVNIKRMGELMEQGLVQPKGMAAFEARKADKSVVYAYEQAEAPAFNAEEQAQFERNAEAWAFFQRQAPSYQKASIWHVVSAKKIETRQKRMATLIEDSAAGRRVGALTPKGKS